MSDNREGSMDNRATADEACGEVDALRKQLDELREWQRGSLLPMQLDDGRRVIVDRIAGGDLPPAWVWVTVEYPDGYVAPDGSTPRSVGSRYDRFGNSTTAEPDMARDRLRERESQIDAYRRQVDETQNQLTREVFRAVEFRARIAEAAGLPLLGDGVYEGSDADLVREVESLREAATGRAITRPDDLAAWMREHPAEAIAAIRQARLVEATPDPDGRYAERYLGWERTDWGAFEVGEHWSWGSEDEHGQARSRERAIEATRESLASAGWVVVPRGR